LAQGLVAQGLVAQGLDSEVSIQPYLDRVAQNITEFTLDNGLEFIVLERHQAPVVSFMTYADVGAADEPDGLTGVAHFLEHLAFKGTQRIGTTNYPQEQKILEQLDRVFGQLQALEPGANPTQAMQLEQQFAALKAEAATFVKQNELGQIIEQAGGVGLNATTSTDATRYFYSLPANKLELWMSLESERFLEPIFRGFYEEKDVVLEERRLRLDNDPVNQLFDAVQRAAFDVHPYGRPIIGYEEDIRNLTRANVRQFFETHYGPDNLTIAIVGDVNPQEVKRLAQIYFGRYSTRSLPEVPLPIEPPQMAPKEVTLQLQSQPWYVEAYHGPGIQDPDYVTCRLLINLLSEGRTAILYQSLVEQQQLALSAQGFSGYPNDKYPSLTVFYALPTPGHSLEEVAQALEAELTQLKTESVPQADLQRVKTQVRAGLLRSLQSNMGMASVLVEYQVKTGSWKNLFRELETIDQVTPADIQHLAQRLFQPENRTIGRLIPLE
jgi:predicted Zn-dependent peptidase